MLQHIDSNRQNKLRILSTSLNMRIITELQWYELENPNNDGSNGSIENECRISNDPETSKKKTNQTTTRYLRSSAVSARQLKTCNITQYMCSTSSTTSTSSSSISNQTNTNQTTTTSTLPTNGIIVEAMEVLYEYELYYNQYIDIYKAIIPYLEESIIVNLAFQMGIQQQCRKQNRRRQLLQQRQRFVENTNQTGSISSIGHQFIGIQTKPYDRINPRYTTDRKSTRLNSSHSIASRMPSSA